MYPCISDVAVFWITGSTEVSRALLGSSTGKSFFFSIDLGWLGGVTVMSSESWVEPRQHREEPGAGQRQRQDTQNVRGVAQQTMSGQDQSDEDEKGSPLNAGVEVVVLQHVNGAEMQKEKNKDIKGRRRATQKIHRAKHPDAALPGV